MDEIDSGRDVRWTLARLFAMRSLTAEEGFDVILVPLTARVAGGTESIIPEFAVVERFIVV